MYRVLDWTGAYAVMTLLQELVAQISRESNAWVTKICEERVARFPK